MILKFIRSSFLGRSIYHLSGRKAFRYAEELPDYDIPLKYIFNSEYSTGINTENASINLKEESSTVAHSEYIIVGFDGDDDPENPYNWPFKYKALFVSQILVLTAFVYMSSGIYTPGIEELKRDMNVSQVVATLPLTLFVFGYGIGPMVFSPLSENARFGRTSIYILTLFVFFILQIPTALTRDIVKLCILRFISGFFASPCLATGGASIGDVISMPYIHIGISLWSIATLCGPSFGPIIGAVLTLKANYHWTFWFICMTSGTCTFVLAWMLPESYAKTILYRKAERLRSLTGNQMIVSEGHLENASKTPHIILIETLWRPLEIILFEPVVLLIDLYLGLIYSLTYLWFEEFPIVFVEVKKFSLVQMGIAYFSIIVGVFIAASIYIPVMYFQSTQKMLRKEEVPPEVCLVMAIVGSILMPIGIFIFGWTSASDLPWIGPMVGAAIFAGSAFIVFQSLFTYLSMSFWEHLASVFAGNDLFRSIMAGSFPLFGRPLFLNLSTKRFAVGWGSSIMGFIAVVMIAIPVLFYLNGPKLRARSKYSS